MTDPKKPTNMSYRCLKCSAEKEDLGGFLGCPKCEAAEVIRHAAFLLREAGERNLATLVEHALIAHESFDDAIKFLVSGLAGIGVTEAIIEHAIEAEEEGRRSVDYVSLSTEDFSQLAAELDARLELALKHGGSPTPSVGLREASAELMGPTGRIVVFSDARCLPIRFGRKANRHAKGKRRADTEGSGNAARLAHRRGSRRSTRRHATTWPIRCR